MIVSPVTSRINHLSVLVNIANFKMGGYGLGAGEWVGLRKGGEGEQGDCNCTGEGNNHKDPRNTPKHNKR